MSKSERICNGLGDRTSFHIYQKDWYTMQAYAQLAYDEDKNEISGLCCMMEVKPNTFLLTHPEILKQENTGSTTTLDADACAAYYTKYGRKYDKRE